MLSAGLIFIPMIAFTITILAVVFPNLIDLDHCPLSELCPALDESRLAFSSDYYIDFHLISVINSKLCVSSGHDDGVRVRRC